MENAKTFGNSKNTDNIDPLNSIKRESIERMRMSLLSPDLGDPTEATTALKQIAILRVYHQITRIVQYLDLMDRLEEKLYESIELDLATLDTMDERTVLKLLTIQEQLQKSIVQSNKLLESYIDMNQYPIFLDVADKSLDSNSSVLALPSSDRDAIRDAASQMLAELEEIEFAN